MALQFNHLSLRRLSSSIAFPLDGSPVQPLLPSMALQLNHFSPRRLSSSTAFPFDGSPVQQLLSQETISENNNVDKNFSNEITPYRSISHGELYT
jgi:hypothetical protein